MILLSCFAVVLSPLHFCYPGILVQDWTFTCPGLSESNSLCPYSNWVGLTYVWWGLIKITFNPEEKWSKFQDLRANFPFLSIKRNVPSHRCLMLTVANANWIIMSWHAPHLQRLVNSLSRRLPLKPQAKFEILPARESWFLPSCSKISHSICGIEDEIGIY